MTTKLRIKENSIVWKTVEAIKEVKSGEVITSKNLKRKVGSPYTINILNAMQVLELLRKTGKKGRCSSFVKTGTSDWLKSSHELSVKINNAISKWKAACLMGSKCAMPVAAKKIPVEGRSTIIARKAADAAMKRTQHKALTTADPNDSFIDMLCPECQKMLAKLAIKSMTNIYD